MTQGYYDSKTHSFRCDGTECGHLTPLFVELPPVGFFQITELHDRFAKLFPRGGRYTWDAVVSTEHNLPDIEDLKDYKIVDRGDCANCKDFQPGNAPVVIAGKTYCFGCAFMFAAEYLKHV